MEKTVKRNTSAIISKVFNTLPAQIKKHSKRVMKIAEFIVKQIESGNYYLENNLSTNNILKAVYYHDVGKANVQKEYHFKNLCSGPKEYQLYKSHVQEGLSLFDYDPAVDKKHTFDWYLFNAIKYHHEFEKDESFVGEITYLADTIDNEFLEIATSTKDKFDQEAFQTVFEKMLVTINRKDLNKELFNLINEANFSEKLFNYLQSLFNKSQANNHYGIVPTYMNVFDIYSYKDAIQGERRRDTLENYELFGKLLTYQLNNRFYGKVKRNEFIFLAMKKSLAMKLDKFFIDDLKDLLKDNRLDINEHEMLFITLTITSFNKALLTKISNLLVVNGIDLRKVVLMFDFLYPMMDGNDLENIKLARDNGYKIGVNNLTSNYINLIKEFKFDFAIVDKYTSNEIDTMFTDLVSSLGTEIIFTSPSVEQKYALDNEKQIKHILIRREDEQE